MLLVEDIVQCVAQQPTEIHHKGLSIYYSLTHACPHWKIHGARLALVQYIVPNYRSSGLLFHCKLIGSGTWELGELRNKSLYS